MLEAVTCTILSHVFLSFDKPCTFYKLCSFDHKVEAYVDDEKESLVILNEQIIEIQNLLKEKTDEIETSDEKLK